MFVLLLGGVNMGLKNNVSIDMQKIDALSKKCIVGSNNFPTISNLLKLAERNSGKGVGKFRQAVFIFTDMVLNLLDDASVNKKIKDELRKKIGAVENQITISGNLASHGTNLKQCVEDVFQFLNEQDILDVSRKKSLVTEAKKLVDIGSMNFAKLEQEVLKGVESKDKISLKSKISNLKKKATDSMRTKLSEKEVNSLKTWRGSVIGVLENDLKDFIDKVKDYYTIEDDSVLSKCIDFFESVKSNTEKLEVGEKYSDMKKRFAKPLEIYKKLIGGTSSVTMEEFINGIEVFVGQQPMRLGRLSQEFFKGFSDICENCESAIGEIKKIEKNQEISDPLEKEIKKQIEERKFNKNFKNFKKSKAKLLEEMSEKKYELVFKNLPEFKKLWDSADNGVLSYKKRGAELRFKKAKEESEKFTSGIKGLCEKLNSKFSGKQFESYVLDTKELFERLDKIKSNK